MTTIPSYRSLFVQLVFAADGLSVFDVDELPTDGGSLRAFSRRSDAGQHLCAPTLASLRQRELAAGMTSAEGYANFVTAVPQLELA